VALVSNVRALLLILNAYLTTLSLVGCQDYGPSPAFSATEVSDSHQQPEPEEHQDHCTPFCICACCGAVLDAPPIAPKLTERDPLPPPGKTAPAYTTSWSPGLYAGDDWQPPRV
jgi:hypothetical protein